MKLRSLCASALSLLVVAGALFPISAFAGDKRRVAVMPFEYGAVTTSVGTVDVGKGINSLLITKLVQDGTYSVVDRQMLDAILKEQNLSVSDRADPSTACKIGKLLSVDAMIVVTVTQMGVDARSSAVSVQSVGMGYIPYVGSLPSLGTFRSKKANAKVGIDARIIDVNTGEILATANGTGESTKKGNWALNDSWDWSTGDFKDSVAGEAIIQAVDKLASQLGASASKIPDNQSLAAQNVQGKIAYVKDNTVILNVGQANGIKVGDNLQVEQVKEEIKDPTSGRVLKTLTNTVAVINITEVDKESSTGNIARGAGIKVGDLVKKVTTDVSAVILASPPSGATAATAVKKPVTK
jgi:curli biogenesis system outer membrane secretion channel CsgG